MYNNNGRQSNNRIIEQTIKNNGHNEQWQCTKHYNNNDQQQWLQQTMKYTIQLINNAHWTTRIVTNPWCTMNNGLQKPTINYHNMKITQSTTTTWRFWWRSVCLGRQEFHVRAHYHHRQGAVKESLPHFVACLPVHFPVPQWSLREGGETGARAQRG